MKHTSGNLIVIAAPSGAGKTSLVKALSESVEFVRISVSHTTRPARSSEMHGQDYFFVTPAVFAEMIENNAFLEHATVFGYAYGTSRAWVIEQLADGIDVILEIDWQGARQIKQLFPSAILIFILPPSLHALRDRLQTRGQDDAQTILDRMQAAQNEMSHFGEFDYLVVNDQFDAALSDLQGIILASRLKIAVQRVKQSALLENLLEKR